MEEQTYDVLVIGGGAAGLSGAVTLARSRRTVLVIDSGDPRNAPAGHVHNLLGREGVPPAELYKTGRAEVAEYGGEFLDGTAERAERDGDGFLVTLAGGARVRGRRLLVTTGLTDELPDIPGLAARWGRDVAHCPYCHGYELRDRRIGVLVGGPLSLPGAQLWRQLSDDVLYLLNGGPAPAPEQAEQLAARRIPVVTEPIEAVLTADDRITGVRLAGGRVIGLAAIAVAPRFVARSALLASLGLEPVPMEMNGHVMGLRIPADESGATTVPGVWVAGNVTNLGATVAVAAAAGQTAAAMINMDLIAGETRAAVDEYRRQQETMHEAESWEERYRARPAIWSGEPNSQLVAEAAGLPAGRALDVGCGEGADAVWLAGRGWQVTGVDISAVALRRAAGHAAAAGLADRITLTRADLRAEPPAERSYDLVSAHFMHLPSGARRELYARLAAAVAPGGTLLIVGHHPDDLAGSVRRMHFPDMMFTAEQVAADLDPAEWEIVTAERRPRRVSAEDEPEVTVHDSVLVARRKH
ncbi:bifunctional NAD(P)/FAD-dependent oxidoreductase/class I SAM-dependent methyltransferase [Actinoplanes oblitus]|uniref:Bifunctional NAD(P)/FAD-dependent oxidoreductase/class I SAM-dependent methyltransferase n=1 Tax=Actinoplanes oblitus TaxID=3040509 RepID=A0ABY8W9B1_9ACTN|nr:bifunctional NAD(P)/FAD-dependent oxidoreductase/class I SAM-dependent methyltransferase [Actinoplanes oblitus]WIM94087.1 bifunctional NAD(P)/FAD-dependent oxidoreductase/class I SAM-dependent methyltransferase [Actinoplanes oblitus]